MPARFRDLERALRALGCRVEPPSRGSHYRCYNEVGHMYVIAAGNGGSMEIAEVYLRGLCRTLGLSLAELKKLI